MKNVALTFVDAIRKYGGDLLEDNLSKAYMWVGKAFKGPLEQHLIPINKMCQAYHTAGNCMAIISCKFIPSFFFLLSN